MEEPTVSATGRGTSPALSRLGALVAHPAFVPSLLFVVALALRAPLLRVPVYGDEAGMFYFSRHPFQDAENVLAGTEDGYDVSHFSWWRPLYRLAFAPAAMISFDAYRLQHLLVASALPVLGFLLLRAHAARRWIATAGGAALAVYPVLVHWSEIVFPDTPMTVIFMAALLAHARRSIIWTGTLFAAAVWMKETAIVGVAVVFVWSAWEGHRAGLVHVWQLRFDPMSAAIAWAAALGMAPLWVYLHSGGISPGWTPGVNGPEMLDTLLPSLWLAPLIVIGLFAPRTRLLSALVLGYLGFYSIWTWTMRQWVQDWYQVQPIALALVALALVVDELFRRNGASVPTARPALPWIACAAVTLFVAVQTLVPSSWEPKSDITMPLGAGAPRSLAESYRLDFYYDARMDLQAQLAPEDYGTIMLVDFPWFFVLHPFSEKSDRVIWNVTSQPFNRTSAAWWANIVENGTDVTIVHTPTTTIHPMNSALREMYAECVEHVNPEYTLIRGQACPDREESLWSTYARHAGREPS